MDETNPLTCFTPLPLAGFGSRGAALIETRDLIYEAGGKRLVDHVDLIIEPGRRTVIMGANGSGKSLLLRLLHGLIVPTSGAIMWKGEPLDRAARRAQAMVFQRPVMLRRSVLANLQFALAVRGFRGAERNRRIADAVRAARLEHVIHRPARVLSGGEQQRLAIARAIACSPELLFLDEPSASLDPASTLAIEQQILAAHERGVTTVLVTHDQGQARRLAQDILFMHHGRLVESGPAAQILDQPRSRAAREWLEGRLPSDDDNPNP